MFRLRRYRVVLVCAFMITVLLYHVSKNSQWDHSREIWRGNMGPDAQARPDPRPPPPPASDQGHKEHDAYGTEKTQDQQHGPPPPSPSVPDAEPNIRIPQLKDTDDERGDYGLPTEPATLPEMKPGTRHNEYSGQNNDGGVQVPPDAIPLAIHWEKPFEWFPVPEESLIPLPTGKPKPIPSVQFSFAEESPAAREKRQQRLAKIKAEAQHAWAGYKKYAWTHDELTPVTKRAKDPFCGWAATLVDSLDTLWIMGMRDEFDDAVAAVKEIDFTTTPYREDIPVFETTIRYLGGLLGAYDVTGNDPQYRVLLDKAVELAEILMGVFDTPNRMPILYYHWKPAFTEKPKRASTSAGVAELGSLSMEFTRLAQLTGQNKYYDAVARITDAFEDLQNRQNRERGTAIPGIFPEHLDASGCNRTAPPPSSLENSSEAARAQANNDDLQRAPAGYEAQSAEGFILDADVRDNTGNHRGPQKRADGPPDSAQTPLNAKGLPANWDCAPQGLIGSGWGGTYSMGGNQDSTYEYFPKQYLLLGGLEPKYRTMHEKTVEAVDRHLLFRPMAEGDPDILFSAKAYTSDGTLDKMVYEYEVTHLTCFLGGMFGLGGKIFDRPKDVEIGKKLADGCVWAYEIMPAGVMPEFSHVLPCKTRDGCHYDQEAWYTALDPLAERREADMAEYYTQLAEWKERVEELKREHALQKQADERARQDDSQRQAAAETVRTSVPTESEDSPGALKEKIKRFQDSFDLDSDGTSGPNQQPISNELVLPPAPVKPSTHQEYVGQRIKNEHIPPGFVTLNDKRYILRPEAIESVWYMYRITGDPSWQEKGWRMFEAIITATKTEAGHSAIRDVTTDDPGNDRAMEDSMESFWLAETLKYFYLLFETPDVISLDEWVLNTEAHPFRRPT
ncbi:glycoside hydrolase [Corynascus novoguineensis]|uniref:alpha-1,2-Mannosidase n=1 Tax=Corynascus novoguineensis TaxID=1126955 RepID=A0AAN7CXF3_9PEZI|nr:glycoside hydrolase [Corynascus novoguineensis]